MGIYFTDNFSLLHIASGVIVYYWNISFIQWFIIHGLFEIIENSNRGVYTINKYLTFWPGGKPKSDTIINSIGDQFYSSLGWVLTHLYLKFVYGGYV
jgi:hypothetical protein